jgi:hypothetical protein
MLSKVKAVPGQLSEARVVEKGMKFRGERIY